MVENDDNEKLSFPGENRWMKIWHQELQSRKWCICTVKIVNNYELPICELDHRIMFQSSIVTWYSQGHSHACLFQHNYSPSTKKNVRYS